MRLSLGIIVGGLALVPADGMAAKSTLLQSVDLIGMSTEGGEASLNRVGEGKGRVCRIDVTHFGETGKTTLTFTFGSTLIDAARTDFHYVLPLYEDPSARVARTDTVTLASAEGQETLPKDFEEYRSLFDARLLATCSQE